MKDLIKDMNIPEKFINYSFVKSLAKQYKDGDLSENQINALNNMISDEVLEVPTFETKLVYVVKEYFYRPDYHGDMLEDSNKIVVSDLSDINLDDKIQNLHSAQYSYESYINKFSQPEELVIPVTKYNDNMFFMMWLEDFNLINAKIERNKFRSTKTKNDAIKAITSILNGEGNKTLVDRVTGKAYNNNYKR